MNVMHDERKNQVYNLMGRRRRYHLNGIDPANTDTGYEFREMVVTYANLCSVKAEARRLHKEWMGRRLSD